jgi:Putative metal-binding motif
MKKFLLLIFLLTFSLGQSQTPAAGPTTPPARNAWDVFSQYGSAYTNLAGVVFDNFGGGCNIVGDVTLADSSIVKKYLSHSYSGIKVNGAGSLNVTSMTKLHLDVWSPDFVSFKIKLEAANGSYNEIEVPFAKTQNSWNSYDLDLSTYTGVDLANLRWIVPVTYGPNNTTLFISNVYFYRPATSIPQPTITGFSVPSQLVGAAPFTISNPTSNSAGAFTYTSMNTSVATIIGNTVTIVGAGTATIVANQAADGAFLAGSANASLVVTYSPPMTAAPTPTVPQANVISLFSDAYSPSEPSGTNWFPNWGQSTQVSDVLIAGNNTKLYNNFNYEGTIWTPHLDASSMVSLHIDVYTPNSTFLRIYPIVDGQPEQYVEVNPTASSWNSFDILLSQYSIPLADIKEFKMVGSNGSTVYFDNLYFSNVPLTVNPTLSAFTVPAKVTSSPAFALTAPTSNSAGAFSYMSSDPLVATVLGNMVTIVGVGTTTITATQAAAGSYNSGTITASLVVTAPLATVPTTAAPTPTRNSVDVISVFSDAYTSVSTNFFPNWGQGTLQSTPSIAGNPTLLYTNLDYEGIEFAAPINAGAMTNLHLDIWTPDVSPIEIYLIAGGENAVTLTPTLSGWNSFDIDLTLYSNAGRTLNNIIQFKIVKPGFVYHGENNAVYFDNIYFWKPAGSPTYGIFFPTEKLVSDADSAIVPPTSTSPVAFTYSSSNTNVATIIGGMVHIVGAGTTIITASQAAGSGFLAGSISTTLVVSYPALMVAAPVPTVPAANVLSIFSDTYSNLSGTDFFPNWGQSTQVTDIVIAGNNTKKYTNLNYQGTQFASAIDASQMFRLHFDIYSHDCTSFKVFPIVPSQPEQFVELIPTLHQWNSFDIDLSQYTIPLNNVIQFKIVGTNGSTVYLDNIYFSNVCYTQTNFFADADGDGFGNAAMSQMACIQPTGYVTNSTDCNDANPAVNPGHAEVLYNGIDDNCDGNLDEGHQLTTKVRLTQCATTLPTLQSTVYSNEVVANASGYRYKVVNNTTGATQYLVKTDITKWWFQFSTLSAYAYNTAYTISVELQVAGTWLGYYGAECVVATPSPTVAGAPALNSASCGITLTNFSQNISSVNVANATVYRIKLTNSATAVSQTIDRSLPWFNMTMFAPKPTYGTMYNVEIAVKTATSDFGAYGASCSITTPAVEGLQTASCGVTATTRSFAFYTNSKPNVNYYVYELTNTVTNAVQYISRTSNWFNFSHCPSGFTVNTFYAVRVAYSTDPSSWSAFSTSCTIKSPAALTKGLFTDADETTVATDAFKVLALPNPFISNFGLDLTSFTDSNVTIQIYDMIGKLLENREVKYTEVVDQTMGDNYPSGVYNVIVSQGEIIRTLRVIKR